MFLHNAYFNGEGIENWDVSNVENMSNMFYNCWNFDGKSIKNWNVSNVKDMSNMFYDCVNFDGDLDESLKHLVTPLQLLSQNTGISYPFADRLIEYLVGNAVTSVDDIPDNIKRAKKVINAKTNALRDDEGV